MDVDGKDSETKDDDFKLLDDLWWVCCLFGPGLCVLYETNEVCKGVFVQFDAKGFVWQENMEGARHLEM